MFVELGGMGKAIPRRRFLQTGLAAGASLAAAGPIRSAGALARPTVAAPLGLSPLPSAQALSDDMATMVGFGPRTTGSTAHNDFLGWLRQELVRAGCSVLPDSTFPCNLWEAQEWSLTILDGAFAGPVPVAAYTPRGGETPPGGATGKLIYAGRGPSPSFNGDVTDAVDLLAAVRRYQHEAADWLSAAAARLGEKARGAILLVDSNFPPPLSEAAIFALVGAYYSQFPGGEPFTRPYKKNWLDMGIGGDLGAAAGAVFIADASFDALVGNYAPFGGGYAGFPSVSVDRDTGALLRKAAVGKPRARLTMTARKTRTTSPSIVAIQPGDGSTDQVVVLNSHTDGTNFAEENGGVAMVAIARYFQQLRRSGRGLRRSLVFSGVTGHFNGDPGFPQTQGFVDDHPDLVQRAAFGMTIEHIGCAEWFDDARGYYPTGLPDPAVMYHDETLLGPVFKSFATHNLPNHALARAHGSFYFGVGGALQKAGIPSMSFISGPSYLVQNGPTQADGVLDKLDADLAARQVAWFIDILTRLDTKAPTKVPLLPVVP